MATETIKTVAGNTAPPLVLTLKREGNVIDLTGCTVALIISNGSVITNTGHQAAVIIDAVNGKIRYIRQTGDLTLAGTYTCDVKITYSDATFEILYDQLKLKARQPLA